MVVWHIVHVVPTGSGYMGQCSGAGALLLRACLPCLPTLTQKVDEPALPDVWVSLQQAVGISYTQQLNVSDPDHVM
jgi:hypothetical protein